jgi:hypothetical protein
MWLRLRQIALIVKDMKSTDANLRSVFDLDVGYSEESMPAAYGLENGLYPIGTQFLEVVALTREGTQGHRYHERRGGDGGYMVILQCDEHAPRVNRVENLGVRQVARRDAPPDYCMMQLHPKDTGGSFLEIDWHTGADDPVPPWAHAAGHNWQKAMRTTRIDAITAAEVQAPDPGAVAARWSEIMETPLRRVAGNPTIALDNALIRFVPDRDGRGEGLGGIDVHTVDRAAIVARARAHGLLQDEATVMIAGTRFRLV